MPARSSVEGTFGFGIPRTAVAPRVWSTVQNRDGSVTAGGGTAISYFIIGPNGGGGAGWTVVKSFFPSAITISYTWNWSTIDGISWDWPFAIVTASEPFSYSSPPKLASTNVQSGSSTLSVPAGQWASFGVFSADSCCGDGRCTFSGLPAT